MIRTEFMESHEYRTPNTRLDDPERYASVHETIRDHRHDNAVALCHECMNSPCFVNGEGIRDVRCEVCKVKHRNRITSAASARGGY
jgi:hypothetical protein